MRKLYILILFVLGLFIFPSVSKAEMRCANGAETLELCDTIIIDTDFISPSSLDEADVIVGIEKKTLFPDNYPSLTNCNNDFTQCDILYKGQLYNNAEIHYKKYISDFDEFLDAINSIEFKTYELSDMDIINYYLYGNQEKGTDAWETGNLIGEALDFSSDFHKDLGDTDVEGQIYTRKGGGEIFSYMVSGNLLSRYRGNFFTANKSERIVFSNVIYVPEGTQNYLETAQQRINAYYGDGVVTLSYGGTIEDDLINEEYNFEQGRKISDSGDINSIMQSIEYEKNHYHPEKTDGNYYRLTIGNKEYLFMIYESNTKIKNDTYKRYSSLLTGIEIISNNMNFPNNYVNNSFLLSKDDIINNNISKYTYQQGVEKTSFSNFDDKYGDINSLVNGDYYLYDVSLTRPLNLLDKPSTLITEGNFTIKLPIPDTMMNNQLVVSKIVNNELIDVDASFENGYAIFDVNNSNGLYVIRIGNNYVIEYDCGSGTGTAPMKDYISPGSDYTISNTAGNCEKEGYFFHDWNTSPEGLGRIYIAGQNIVVNDDLKLYATWFEHAKYNVIFHSNNPKSETATQELYDNVNTKLNKNSFTYNGYKFVEWNTKSNGKGDSYEDESSIILTSGNIDLYAIWSPIEYIIDFDCGIDSTGTPPSHVTGYFDETITLADNYGTCTKNNSYFVSWNTKADGSGSGFNLGGNYVVNDNATMYAIWEEEQVIQHIVTFHSNFGNDETTTQSIPENELTKLDKNTFVNSGYIFTGWNTRTDGQGMTYTNEQLVYIYEDVDLYAQWVKDPDGVMNNFKKQDDSYEISVDYVMAGSSDNVSMMLHENPIFDNYPYFYANNCNSDFTVCDIVFPNIKTYEGVKIKYREIDDSIRTYVNILNSIEDGINIELSDMDLIDYYIQGYKFPSADNDSSKNINILEDTVMFSSDYKDLINNTDIIGSLISRKGTDGLFSLYMGANLKSNYYDMGVKNIALSNYINYTIKYVVYVPENTTNIIKSVQDRLDSIYGKNKYTVTLGGSIEDFYNETYMHNPGKKPSDYYPSAEEMVSDFQNRECDRFYDGEVPTNYYKININGVDFKFIVLKNDSKVQNKEPIEFKNAVNNTSIVVNNPRIGKSLSNGTKVFSSQDSDDTEFAEFFVDEGKLISVTLGDLDYDYAYSYNISLLPISISPNNLQSYTDNTFKLPLSDYLKNQNFEVREISYDNLKMKVTSEPIDFEIKNNNIIINSNKTSGLYGIRVIKLPQSISYTTHVQNIGWQDYVKDGAMAGTSGLSYRLEGIKIKLDNQDYPGDIEYRTHVQNIGWQDYVKNGAMAGTSGLRFRLEAIQIRLTGEMAEHYDVYYRVHAQYLGWMNWAKNDELAGTAGLGYRLEGIEIALVEKGNNPPTRTNQNFDKAYYHKLVKYTTHVQNIGWQDYVKDGAMAGTSGLSYRLEGIKIELDNQDYSGDIEYRTHVQNIGWQDYVKNGAMAGTEGLRFRLEAIQIRLTGEMAEHYDVYYRVHAQYLGWMEWAKNDEMAGTSGFGYRLEGIEILLVEKGGTPPKRANQNYDQPYLKK